MMAHESDVEHILAILTWHGVKFVIVGGQAATLHGAPYTTFDLDICYERSVDNLRLLAEALKQLDPKLRDAPDELPLVIDSTSLALGGFFTFTTKYGDLDLLAEVTPVGVYQDLLRNAETLQIGGATIHTISLEDLIRVKEYWRRPKDERLLEELRIILRERTPDC